MFFINTAVQEFKTKKFSLEKIEHDPNAMTVNFILDLKILFTDCSIKCLEQKLVGCIFGKAETNAKI